MTNKDYRLAVFIRFVSLFLRSVPFSYLLVKRALFPGSPAPLTKGQGGGARALAPPREPLSFALRGLKGDGGALR